MRRNVWTMLSGAAAASWLAAVSGPASALAAPAPTLTITAQGQNTLGGAVTLTAHPANWPAAPEVAWWVQEPNGQWRLAQGYSTAPLTLSNLHLGSYLVVATALTPEELARHDWRAAVTAQYVVNVDTGVRITSMTPATPTPGQPVTITAQATNLSNVVYQFWVEQNGHWTGSNYSPSNTFTFTPTTANFKVAVYAKTLEEPNTGGDPLGVTAQVSVTPAVFAPDAALMQQNQQVAQTAWQQIVQQYPQLAGTNGLLPPSVFNAPPLSQVQPLIPASFWTVPAGTNVFQPIPGVPEAAITGLTATWHQMEQQGVPQAGASGAQPLPDWIPNSVWQQGLKQAAEDAMISQGNDGKALMNVMAPDMAYPGIFSGTSQPGYAQWVHGELSFYQSAMDPAQSGSGYTYAEVASVAFQNPAQTLSLNGVPSATGNMLNMPGGLLQMTVPVKVSLIGTQVTNGRTQLIAQQMTGYVQEELVQDSAAGGYRWLVEDVIYKSFGTPQVLKTF